VIRVHVESTTAARRVRSFALAPVWFLRLAALELFALWLIVATGAAVRLTASGLGCRHWPGCEAGHPLPAKDYHAFIEFGNRLVGGVTIVLTLLVAVAAWRTPLGRGGRRLAVALFAGTLAQAPLGYLAVKTDLRWPVVMAHLLLSMLLIAGAVLLVFAAAETVELLAECGARTGRQGEADRIARQRLTMLETADIGDVFQHGLHEWLIRFIADNDELGRAIAAQFRFP
jgi:heme A synthase